MLQPIDDLVAHLKSNQPYNKTGALKLHEALIQLSDAIMKFGAIKSKNIAPGAITIPSLDTSVIDLIVNQITGQANRFSTDIVFSATDFDTVQWTSGTIKLDDGTSYSISSGNTGNMTVLTYIYLDINISTTVLQVTTNFNSVIDTGTILLCVAKPATSSIQNAFFVPAVGVFGINETVIGPNSISTGKIQANAITANEINANAVTTAKLDALSVTSAKIAADAVIAGKIAAGAIDAMTITGATIRNTSSGNNRIQLNSTAFTVTDSGGNEFFQIAPGIIGGLINTISLYQHPSVSGTFILSGKTDGTSNVLIQTADGTTLGNRSAVQLRHGTDIQLVTINTLRATVDSAGITLASGLDFIVANGRGIKNGTEAIAFDSSAHKLVFYAGSTPHDNLIMDDTVSSTDTPIQVRVNSTLYRMKISDVDLGEGFARKYLYLV